MSLSLSPVAYMVDVARRRAVQDPRGYRDALLTFAAASGTPVRVPGPAGRGVWISPRRARAELRSLSDQEPTSVTV